ncbi:DoxX family protein [Puniceicoccaceae bacterium K14]|nr:DoxX family protein [Puniceicoccaceae bacterium K14]
MKHGFINKDIIDILFRASFSFIFLGLGGEHILSDELIQKLMPTWIPFPGYVSILCGILLMIGGILIVIGYKIRLASLILGLFIVGVTAAVHAPALFATPDFIAPDNEWIWSILQRSNFAKNLCLLGVCLLLSQYKPGRYSVTRYLEKKKSQQ